MVNKNQLEHYFHLLHDILSDTFHIDSYFLEYPYNNLEKIDNGIRGTIWKNMDYLGDSGQVLQQVNNHPLTVIKSNLGFYNILCRVSLHPHPAYITIGPFRDTETTPQYYEEIIRKTRLPQTDILSMQQMYRKIPMISVKKVLKITKRILSEVIKNYNEIEEYLIEFTEADSPFSPNADSMKQHTIDYAEHIRGYVCDMYTALKKGSSEPARDNLHKLLEELNTDNLKDRSILKQINQTINNICMLALFRTNVHPTNTLNLYNRLIILIEGTGDIQKLEYLPYDICHKYYLLVQNYNHPDYTKLTRDVINYIHFHLEEELTLSSISKHFEKNPSSLSGNFTKDTGLSLTEYIHRERIGEAIRLLNSTNQSISDISVAVGFKDFAYFSRIFKKEIGISPREYRNTRK